MISAINGFLNPDSPGFHCLECASAIRRAECAVQHRCCGAKRRKKTYTGRALGRVPAAATASRRRPWQSSIGPWPRPPMTTGFLNVVSVVNRHSLKNWRCGVAGAVNRTWIMSTSPGYLLRGGRECRNGRSACPAEALEWFLLGDPISNYVDIGLNHHCFRCIGA